MIFFDITKTGSVRHRSGLARMNERLREELGESARADTWERIRDTAQRGDWFVTTELFSEVERPGFGAFLRKPSCRTAAVFADAIPMKHPHITWPKSVARHPAYMKMLAGFEKVWAISQASRDELTGYWRWLGLEKVPQVEVLPLGADLSRVPRGQRQTSEKKLSLLCVGILEPRKNQLFLLDVCEELWASGLAFELHIVGRVNPHFGAPIVARIKAAKAKYPGLHYHEAARDDVLAALYAGARATVFPTIAEGCGLPLLESLWHGVPCICSDLPVLRENADGGGCLPLATNDRAVWSEGIRDLLTDDGFHGRLVSEATSRSLPTWSEGARVLLQELS